MDYTSSLKGLLAEPLRGLKAACSPSKETAGAAHSPSKVTAHDSYKEAAHIHFTSVKSCVL